jgi:hypothetical protein
MQHNGWDHGLTVTADGTGLIGHAGAVLLRKAADQAGLTAGLSSAFRQKNASPLLDRGAVLVSMAVAIALGAVSMSDIGLLAHLAPVLGASPSGPTVRRALELAGGTAMADRAARARARARAHVWKLLSETPGGFPWLTIAGKTLAGWLVIDMDATLVTARSPKEGAAPTWKMGFGFHPLGAWLANTRECLAMLLRLGIAQDGDIEEDKDVAEITHLMSRAGNWPDGLRWIARRVKPSCRQMRNLTDYEKKTGWRYSITCTNIQADQHQLPRQNERRTTRRGRSRCRPGHAGQHAMPDCRQQADTEAETRRSTISNRASGTLND